MDRSQLAHFLRSRRAGLRPEDVGLPRGPRRRLEGLRREEVAFLCDMSVDYYTKLEQPRGPVPSPQMLMAVTRGMRLDLRERDHLFRIAGQAPPAGSLDADHVNPGMMRILDRLEDTAAQVINDICVPLHETHLVKALFGDRSHYEGLARSKAYRWFTDPGEREIHPVEDHPRHARVIVGNLREAYARRGRGSRVADMVDTLVRDSDEFADLWGQHVVLPPSYDPVRLLHPAVGPLELQAQTLVDPDQSQQLLVYTAAPGSESQEKLRLLSATGGDAEVRS